MSERYDPNYFGQALQSFSSAMASPYAQIIQEKMKAQDEARKRMWKLEDINIRGGVDTDNYGNKYYASMPHLATAQNRLTPEMIGYTADSRGNMYGNADITSGGMHPLRATQINSNSVTAGYDNWSKMSPEDRQRYNQAQNGNPFNAYISHVMQKAKKTGQPIAPNYTPSQANLQYDPTQFGIMGGNIFQPLQQVK